MTRHTSRARVNDLVEELAIGAAIRMRCDSDDIRAVVQAVVAYLTEEYPSQDLYIPSSTRYPVDQIRADVHAGRSMRSICRRYRIGRQTIYKLLDDPST